LRRQIIFGHEQRDEVILGHMNKEKEMHTSNGFSYSNGFTSVKAAPHPKGSAGHTLLRALILWPLPLKVAHHYKTLHRT
jgi:hypothetical protein